MIWEAWQDKLPLLLVYKILLVCEEILGAENISPNLSMLYYNKDIFQNQHG